jgi:hypothetical protein
MIHFPRPFVAHVSEPLISHVAVWKQLHLEQWFSKTRNIRSWKTGQVLAMGVDGRHNLNMKDGYEYVLNNPSRKVDNGMVLQLLVLKNDKQRMLRKGIRFLWLL